MINLSPRFKERVESLWKSQMNRSREKKNKNGKVIKQGYILPFDKKQFTCWLLDLFGGENNAILCRYCRTPIDAYNCELDHGVPLSRGGSPALTNIDPTCAPCNDVKGKMTPEEMVFFLELMQQMSARFFNGLAVKNITHRLESYSKMKATVNHAHAARQKAPVQQAVAEEPC